MMFALHIPDIEAAAKQRPAGYVAHVRSLAVREQGEYLYVTREAYDALWAKYGTSKGLGDTVHKLLIKAGVARIVKAGTVGGCKRCGRRRRWLNALFPYGKS